MKIILSKITTITFFILFFNVLHVAAQGNGHNKDKGIGHNDHGNGKGKGHDKHNSVPIDGGASMLLAAGAAYGIKKLIDYRKEENRSNH